MIQDAATHAGAITEPPHGGGSARGVGVRSDTVRFWTGLPAFSRFEDITDRSSFTPVPDGWTIGLADVEASTRAIAAGRYKRVNTAGAAVVSAVSNALGHLDFPFLFSGDGASFAVAPSDAAAAADALAATVSWVGEALDLPLRGATLPIRAIRDAGRDVRVGRFAASPNASYAMFSGGGLAWAEERLKAGTLPTVEARPGARPDLTGLTCRFQVHKAKHGLILSVLVRPTTSVDDPQFRTLVREVLALAEAGPDMGRPLPRFEPLAALTVETNRVQARLHRKVGEPMPLSWLRSIGGTLAAVLFLGTGATVGKFSAKRYLRDIVENSDFRKYDDGLMLTLDCSPMLADAVEARLARAEVEGVARFGLHRQPAATVTCVVPSATRSDHVHFIDGASGGYAEAARALKLHAGRATSAPAITEPRHDDG